MDELLVLGKTYFDKYRSFILYISIGFTGLAADMLTFLILVDVFKIDPLVVNPISMSVGIVNNFFLNAYFNFKKTDNLLRRLASFYVVGLFGIIVSDAFIWLFHDVLVLPLIPVKAVSIVLIAIMQYFLNRTFSFSSKK